MAEPTRDLPPIKNVAIEWLVPPGMEARFADNFLVQHTEHEFRLYFFQARPPLILGTDEERASQVAAIQKVPVECVAQLVVSPTRIPQILDALKSNLDRFMQRYAETDPAPEKS